MGGGGGGHLGGDSRGHSNKRSDRAGGQVLTTGTLTVVRENREPGLDNGQLVKEGQVVTELGDHPRYPPPPPMVKNMKSTHGSVSLNHSGVVKLHY